MTLRNKFIHYVSSNIISMIGLSFYILVDTFFISLGMGSNGLAALNLALPIYNLISGLGLMCAIGGAAQFITFKTTEKKKEADTVFSTNVLMILFFGFFFVLTGLFFSDTLASLLGANKEIFDMTSIYIRYITIFAPFFMMNNLFSSYTKNDGAPRLAMIGMLAGSLFNIIFDYILIFKLHLGMKGAVLATGFSPVVGMLILSTRFIKKETYYNFTHYIPSYTHIIKTITLGLPTLINEMASGIVMVVFNFLILHLSGNNGVASYGVLVNIYLVVVCLFNGIAQGAQPLMGESYASNNLKDLHTIFKYSLLTGALLSIASYVFLVIFKTPVVSVFNSEGNASLQHMAESGLILYFMAMPFMGFNVLSVMYLVSLSKAFYAQVITLLRGIILLIPIAFIMSMAFKMTGVWLTLTITESITALITLIILKKKAY